MRPIGEHHQDQSFGSQIDKLIESLKSAGHSHTVPSRNSDPDPTDKVQYFPATPEPGIHTTSHGGFTTTSQTTKPKSPPPPPSFYYPLFQFHNKYADRPTTRRPSGGTQRPTPKPVIVTWRPEKGSGMPEKQKGNQFVGGVTSLVSNIAVYEEDKYRPQQETNYITGENVIPEMAGGGNAPDYPNIEYLDYIEGPNVINEMTQRTTTKRPAITFFPPPTAYPTRPPMKERPPTYKPQHHFPTTGPPFPSFTTNKPHFPSTPNRPPSFDFPPFEENKSHFPTTKPTYRPTFTLIPFNPRPQSPKPRPSTTARPTFTTSRPTGPTQRPPTIVTEPTSGTGVTTPQSYTPQFNPLFTKPASDQASESTSNRLPFSYPSSPFSYKPTYRPGFHHPGTRPSFFNTNLPTRSTPKSPYKPTFKPAILATFAPSISISSLLPFSNTSSTTPRPNQPYPFATYPFPILPDFDPITNKPAEFIDSIQAASTATPTYFPSTSSSSTTTATQTTATTTTSTTTTTPEPDVVTIPGLPGIAIPSTPAAWAEYISAGINEIFGLFRASLIFTQSAEGQEASKDVGALTAVLGLPLVTGGLSMLGAGPAAVIAVAWLLPVASLLLLPGLAG